MSVMDVFTKAVQDDPAGAAVLMDHVALAVLNAELAKSAAEIDAAFLAEADTRLRRAMVALSKDYVSKAASGTYPGDEHLQTGQYLADLRVWLSKAAQTWETWNSDRGRQRRWVARDVLGRFTSITAGAKDVVGSNVDAEGYEEGKLAAPVRRRLTVEGRTDSEAGRWAGAPDEAGKINLFQGRFEAAVGNAQTWAASLGEDAKHAKVILQVKDRNRPFVVDLNDLSNGQLPSNMQVSDAITGIKLVPSPGASDDVADKIAGYSRGGAMQRAFNEGGKGGKLGQFFATRGEEPRMRALMGRIGIVGDILATANPASKTAKMAQLVGTFGPEAAAVMEPHVRRTAYRYRGTERTPDRNLVAEVQNPELRALGTAIDDNGALLKETADQLDRDPETLINPVKASIVARARMRGQTSGDSLELGVRSDVAALGLLRDKSVFPDKSLVAELSRQAGNQLPSHGVLIDRQGDVVSQSVGFADDHYLPFNLGNMSRLRGGQYVRTRQQGGLTGEDIYAAVFHGARSASVVSSSGVFRVEFAPDFRGARANSDKAFSMYDRYLRILQAVDNGGVYALDIDASEKASIREKVKRLHPNLKGQELKDAFEAEYDKKRAMNQGVSAGDIENLRQDIRDDLGIKEAGPGKEVRMSPSQARAFNDEFEERFQQLVESKVKALNLNGEGYFTALETLKHQFPYFIRSVEWEPLRGPKDGDPMTATRAGMGFLAARGQSLSMGPRASRGKDAGYLRPGTLSVRDRDAAGRTTTSTPTGGSVEPAATTGAQRPATATQAAQAPAATASTSVVDTTSPAARAAALRGRLSADDKDRMVSEFASQIVDLTKKKGGGRPEKTTHLKDEDVAYGPYANKDFSELATALPVEDSYGRRKAANVKAQLMWFLDRPSADDMGRAFEEHGDEAFTLFAGATDSEILSAITTVWSGTGIGEILEDDGPFGAKTPEELASSIRQGALDIAEHSLLSATFRENDGKPETLRSVTGSAIAFDDIVNLENAADVQAFATANPDLAKTAEALGTKGDGYVSLRDTALRMTEVSNALKALEKAREMWEQAGDEQAKAAIADDFKRRNGLGVNNQLSLVGGMSPEDLDKVFSDDPPDLGAKWSELQRARTFLEVARVYGALPESRVPSETKAGGVRPKGVYWRPVAKASSPRRAVRVLAPDHPVSKAVAARRGLSLDRPRR